MTRAKASILTTLAAAALFAAWAGQQPAQANDPLRRGRDFLGATPERLLRDLGAPRRLAFRGDTALWIYEALDRSELEFVLHADRVVFVDGDARQELLSHRLPVVRDGEVHLDDGRIYKLSECPPLDRSGIYLGQAVEEVLDRLGPAESFGQERGAFTLDYGERGQVVLHQGRVVGVK